MAPEDFIKYDELSFAYLVELGKVMGEGDYQCYRNIVLLATTEAFVHVIIVHVMDEQVEVLVQNSTKVSHFSLLSKVYLILL